MEDLNKFEDWWKVYPKKNKKKPCRDKWARNKLDLLADTLINDVKRRIQMCPRWKAGFIPDPLTYLNQERWEDEIEEERVEKKLPRNNEDLEEFALQFGIKTQRGETYPEFRKRIEREMR